MKKILIIIQREYLSRVKRKSFIVTTLLAPLGFFALIAGSAFISTVSQGRTDVAVIDDSGLFRDLVLADAEDQTVYFHHIQEKYETISANLQKVEKDSKKYSAIIHIPNNFNINSPNNPVISYQYVERPGLAKKQFINLRINEAVEKQRMKMLQIPNEIQEQMQQKVQLDYSSLDHESEKKGYTEAAGVTGMVMGFAIYISLFFYGTMIMKGVMEEKTNRIVEVLTSSVKPFQLLMGKILGVGAVGLTQFILWIGLMFLVNLLAGVIFGMAVHSSPVAGMSSMNTGNIDPDEISLILNNLSTLPFTQIMLLFPLYFLGGFLLYGSLFAAVGAAMGEDGDQQSLMVPITIPIVLSIFISINIINNPDSALGFWGSLFPLTSPVVMSSLLPFRPVWWQVALSLFFLVVGFILTTMLAAKIYRVGILMYGKKISLREMGRWVFAKT